MIRLGVAEPGELNVREVGAEGRTARVGLEAGAGSEPSPAVLPRPARSVDPGLRARRRHAAIQRSAALAPSGRCPGRWRGER